VTVSGRPSRTVPPYLACFAAQIGALGVDGQRRLQRASVLVVGAGGLGTAMSLTLANAGVGTLVVVDPQRVAAENFNRYPFARPIDIGKPKVDVLASFFEGRPHLKVVPIVGRAESIESGRVVQDVQLVITASNTVPSRLAAMRFAARHHLAHVSAALADGRARCGGFVTAWVPERPDLACPACFLTPRARLDRGESLLATVVSVVGALAACLAVQLLAVEHRPSALEAGNCLTIDMERYAVESLRVLSRHDCPACVGVRGSTRSRRRR
jgi:molybdopterin/thiamine biosynthesis adenylyltransferase